MPRLMDQVSPKEGTRQCIAELKHLAEHIEQLQTALAEQPDLAEDLDREVEEFNEVIRKVCRGHSPNDDHHNQEDRVMDAKPENNESRTVSTIWLPMGRVQLHDCPALIAEVEPSPEWMTEVCQAVKSVNDRLREHPDVEFVDNDGFLHHIRPPLTEEAVVAFGNAIRAALGDRVLVVPRRASQLRQRLAGDPHSLS